MKWLSVLVAATLLGVSVGACGSQTPARGYLKGDGDADNDSQIHDDYRIRGYGQAASLADVQAVTALVKHYYALAVAGKASQVCSLVDSTTSHTEGVSFPEGYVLELVASEFLQDESCVQFISPRLKAEHRRLAEELATVKITGVRTSGRDGFVLLAFRTVPERVIPVERVRGAWEVATLLPSTIP